MLKSMSSINTLWYSTKRETVQLHEHPAEARPVLATIEEPGVSADMLHGVQLPNIGENPPHRLGHVARVQQYKIVFGARSPQCPA